MGPTRLRPSVANLLEALKGPEPLTCFRAPPFSPAIERQMTELLSQCRNGRELAAHGALLDDIEDHLETLGLGALAAVLVAVAQSPKVHSVIPISDWPWPLAAAAGAKAGPALVEAAQAALHSQESVSLRGLALRLLALTMDVRLETQALVEAVRTSMCCHVATEHTAAAFAILALVRRHPFIFRELLGALRNGLASPATSDEARGYLLQACWCAPPMVSLGVRRALEASLPSLAPQPSLLLQALEALACLPLVREPKAPQAMEDPPDPLVLTITELLRHVGGTQHITVAVAAAALLCRILCRKSAPRAMVDAVLLTLCEHLEAPATPLVKALYVKTVASLLAVHQGASTTRLLDALVQVARSASYSGSEALSPLPLACLTCLTSRTFERRSGAQDTVLKGLLAAVQERCSRVLGGQAGSSTLLDEARDTGEVRWLVSALLMLAGSGQDGAHAAVQIALQCPASLGVEVLPQVAWVDRWQVTATALQPDGSWDVSRWVALLRASRGLSTDESSTQAAQALDRALQDTVQEEMAMEVDGQADDDRRLSGGGVWPRYQLAREAILNGFYAPARRALEGLEGSSECMCLWLRSLRVLCEAESSAALCTEEGLLEARSAYASVIHLLGAIDATHTPHAAGFGFKKRFVEARLELLRVEAGARALCRELMIAGRPAGYKQTRQFKYQSNFPRAFRRLGNIFHGLYSECLQDGAQSRWVLRSLVSVCLLYAKAWELLVLQLSGTKAAVTAASGPWPLKWPTSGPEERIPLFRVCRTLHDRLVDPACVPNKGLAFDDSVKAMLSLIWSLSRVPFPYPRCFFSCDPRPGLHMSLLPLSRPLVPPPSAPPVPRLFTPTPSKSIPTTATGGAQGLPPPLELQPSADEPLPVLEVTCAEEHVSVSILGFLTHCSSETLSVVDQAHIQARFTDSASGPGPQQPSTVHSVTARVDRTGAFQGYLTFKASTLPSAREKTDAASGSGSEWAMAVQTRISTQGGHMWKPSKGATMGALLQLA